MKKLLILIFTILILSFKLYAQKNISYTLEKIHINKGIPWGLTFIKKDSLLISIKKGDILLLNLKNKNIKYIKHNLNILHKGQGGLLDIKKSINFKNDSYIYVTYAKNINNKAYLTLSRAKYTSSFLKFEDIFVNKDSSFKHFGSRITFDKKNHVLFSIGDSSKRLEAQDLSSYLGSILRLNMDGSVPKSNPFYFQKKALGGIYSYGHRNPQGLFFDKKRNILFSNEHGPRGGDEINIIKKGKNYGWPIVSYGKEYTSFSYVGKYRQKEGMENAIKVYTPSIAPSSLLVYSGNKFKEWEGNLFSTSLKLKHINRIVLNKRLEVIKEEKLFNHLNQRIRNIIEDEEGNIYFSTDKGNIYKIKNLIK
ncbi:MAG: PQQ-dependent sugar dehydrogenase [Campylobacterales bacterium]|nr:PQQ-dependent sugar dehydrogenase [Campylobacterales bacterium]